jgi:RNA polymerase sigma-70 factor (ECF subfamily)
MSRENLKEKILYLRLKQKDKEAFMQAYDLYLDDIYRFIFFKVSSKEEAEDISSSVFLKAWNHIQNNSISDYKTLKSLFYKIARNLVIDHYRKNANKNDVSIEADETYLELPDEKQDFISEIENSDDFARVSEKMSELKEEYREVLMLRYINELSVAEIAEILGKSKGNVRVMIYRALNTLRGNIEEK